MFKKTLIDRIKYNQMKFTTTNRRNTADKTSPHYRTKRDKIKVRSTEVSTHILTVLLSVSSCCSCLPLGTDALELSWRHVPSLFSSAVKQQRRRITVSVTHFLRSVP